MSLTKARSFRRSLEREIEKSGLAYNIIPGKKHQKLFIEGHMAMVFSNGQCQSRDLHMVRSIIRKALGAKNATNQRAV